LRMSWVSLFSRRIISQDIRSLNYSSFIWIFEKCCAVYDIWWGTHSGFQESFLSLISWLFGVFLRYLTMPWYGCFLVYPIYVSLNFLNLWFYVFTAFGKFLPLFPPSFSLSGILQAWTYISL
jgi:hypothetical protein